MKDEYLDLPFYNPEEDDYQFIASCFEKIKKLKIDVFSHASIEEIENEINAHICSKLNISEEQMVFIDDLMKYSVNLFHKGQKSIALHPISFQKPETISYAQFLCKTINDFLVKGDYKVNARVYNTASKNPLCLVVLQFVVPNKEVQPLVINGENEFNKQLNKINKYTLQEYSQNIYVRKQIRYFDDDTIYLIKPNQKRFWTRSQGIEDAYSIINEINASV